MGEALIVESSTPTPTITPFPSPTPTSTRISLPIQTDEWIQHAHDAQRTSYTDQVVSPPWRWKWSWNGPNQTGGIINGKFSLPRNVQPVTGGGRVYIAAGSRGIFALNEEDANSDTFADVAWNATNLGTINSTVAYDPDTNSVFVVSTNGNLYKLNSSDGTISGQFSSGSSSDLPLPPAVISDRVFFSMGDNVYAINKLNMTLIWSYNAGSPVHTPPSYSPSRDRVVVTTQDLYVHAINNSNGSRAWKVKPTVRNGGNFGSVNTSLAEVMYGWPVVAEVHGYVLVKYRLDWETMWTWSPWPTDNTTIRSNLQSRPDQQALFVLDLDDGSNPFIANVSHGGFGDGGYLPMGPQPVVKKFGDSTEVVYISIRGDDRSQNGRWDSHFGEMVLDGNTIPGLLAGYVRWILYGNYGRHSESNMDFWATDEQVNSIVAGDYLLSGHWIMGQGLKIKNRSAGYGSYTNPILSSPLPHVISSTNQVSYTASYHSTSFMAATAGGVEWRAVPTHPDGNFYIYNDSVGRVYDQYWSEYASWVVSNNNIYFLSTDGALIALGSQSGQIPTPTPTSTLSLTPTPISSPTPTPTPSPTPTPTRTLTSTATPTPTPALCTLTSARWDASSNPVNQGTPVNLIVEGTGCNGKEVSFEVRENDSILEGGFDESANIQPANAIFSGGIAQTTWIAEFQNDCGGLCNPPEYFFNVKLLGTSTSIRSSYPLLNVNEAPFSTTAPTVVLTPTFIPSPTLTPSPCTLISASWSGSTKVMDGTQVNLNIETIGECSGRSVEYQIWEDDGVFGRDFVKVNPFDSQVIDGRSKASWIAEYQPDGVFGATNPPEYYFEARLKGEAKYIVSSGPLLEVEANPNNLVISSLPIVESSDRSAKISWYTNISSTSQIVYGIPGKRQKTTLEYNTDSLTTYHTVEIDNLKACATYEYIMESRADLASVESSPYTLTTSGCRGNSQVLRKADALISSTSGGVLTLNFGSSISLEVPPNYSDSKDASFQIKQLEGETLFSNVLIPPGYSGIPKYVFNISVLKDISETITEFLSPIGISVNYSDHDLKGTDEANIGLFKYVDETGWERLPDCQQNIQENILSCATYNLSDFAILGVGVSPTITSVSSGGGGGGSSGGPSVPGPSVKRGDLNSDGKINIFDLSIILTNFNKRTTSGDLNGDGVVNIFDLSVLLSNYGK